MCKFGLILVVLKELAGLAAAGVGPIHEASAAIEADVAARLAEVEAGIQTDSTALQQRRV